LQNPSGFEHRPIAGYAFQGYRERSRLLREDIGSEHDWVEEFVFLVPGLYFGYLAYAQLSDGWVHCFSVESVANDHSSNFEIYTEKLYRFSMFDPQYLERKYRRQCFFFGYPGGYIE
jgi:hypothetical protein